MPARAHPFARVLPAVLVTALLPWSAFGAPRARCTAERAGARALVQVEVRELFDDELLRLVRLGLVGTIHLELALVRPRRFWFDERRGMVRRTVVVSWDRGRFLVDQGPTTGLEPLLLPITSVRGEGDWGEAAHHVEANVRLEVVTATSLGQVARWLAQGSTGEAVPKSVLSYLAADLARTAGARCPVR